MRVKKSSEELSQFLNFIRTLKTQYSAHYDAVHDCDEQTQDILHQIELGAYADRDKWATQLAHVRKDRRVHKDFVDVNESLITYLYENKDVIAVIKQLEQILGKLRNQEKYIEQHRIYNAKVIKNLTITQRKDTKNG